MTLLIAVPVARVSCRVVIARARAWSAVDETILLLVAGRPYSVTELATLTDLPRQMIVASTARLMRFRLVQVSFGESGPAMVASPLGKVLIADGHQLPTFPTRIGRRCSFVIERATGAFFPTAQVQISSLAKLQNQPGACILSVEGGGPSLSQADNLARLMDIAVRDWDEQVAAIDPRTASLRPDGEFMLIRVVDGVPQGLPDRADPTFRNLVTEVAGQSAGSARLTIPYAGRPPAPIEKTRVLKCAVAQEDVVIGTDNHRDLFADILRIAHRRIVIHSTFLDAKRFAVLQDASRTACVRGVQIDLLWETKTRPRCRRDRL